MNKIFTKIGRILVALTSFGFVLSSYGACLDNLVLVHGNAGYPSDWNSTVNTLNPDFPLGANF